MWPCCHNHQPQTQQVSPTCACIDVLYIWALYFNWAHLLWLQCTSVTRSICIIRSSNDWWAGLGSRFHHQLMMFHEQNVWVSGHHTQQVSPTCACNDVLHIWALDFNWAHLLWLQCTSVTRSICIIRFSSDWWLGWAAEVRLLCWLGLLPCRLWMARCPLRFRKKLTRSANKDVQLILEKHWSYYAINSCIAKVSLI